MVIDENIFYGKKRELKYLLKENKESKYMIVLFSGLSSHPVKKSVYNYIKCLENIEITRLHILDEHGYDGRGCWYLGENGQLDVEESTIELIYHISSKLKISKENIILAGTSKGGFAGLYLGIKYGYGRVIVGAPQIILGNYLNIPIHYERLKFITGCETEGEKIEAIKRLNSIITKLDINDKTKVNILCGINDDIDMQQIKAFYKKVVNKKNLEIELCSGDHGNIGEKYKIYLPRNLRKIIGCNSNIDSIPTKTKFMDCCDVEELIKYVNKDRVKLYIYEENKLCVDFEPINVNLQYACYLICADTKKVIQKTAYQLDTHFRFDIEEQNYIVKIYIKNKADEKISKSIKFNIKKKLTISKV